MSKLSREEQDILDAVEQGRLQRTADGQEIARRQRSYAGALVKQDARVNRLSFKDLLGLQKRALEEGIPCHTPGFGPDSRFWTSFQAFQALDHSWMGPLKHVVDRRPTISAY